MRRKVAEGRTWLAIVCPARGDTNTWASVQQLDRRHLHLYRDTTRRVGSHEIDPFTYYAYLCAHARHDIDIRLAKTLFTLFGGRVHDNIRKF